MRVKSNKLALRVLSTATFLAMVSSCATAAFADTYDLTKGSVTVNAKSDGTYVTQKDADGSFVKNSSNIELNNYQDKTPVTLTTSGNEPTHNTASISTEKGVSTTVTLDNVNIDASNTDKAAIYTQGKVTLELDGNNTLTGGKGHAALEKFSNAKNNVPDNNYSLTIQDENAADGKTGSLTANGGEGGAGIGGNNEGGYADSITISGGTVDATGGSSGAGIGGGGTRYYSKGGSARKITISGDNTHVTATGGYDGAGIGGGAGGGANGGAGSVSNVTISGGTVVATGKGSAAGIGGGADLNGIEGGSATDITISGGNVIAIGGKGSDSQSGGAGIGGGTDIWGYSRGGVGSNITISGGTVTASSAAGAAGIGGGRWAGAGTADSAGVTITNGTVTANGGAGAAGIGDGANNVSDVGSVISITGGTVKANGGAGEAAGIGNGENDARDAAVSISATNAALDVTAVTQGSGEAITGGDDLTMAKLDNLFSGVVRFFHGEDHYNTVHNGKYVGMADNNADEHKKTDAHIWGSTEIIRQATPTEQGILRHHCAVDGCKGYYEEFFDYVAPAEPVTPAPTDPDTPDVPGTSDSTPGTPAQGTPADAATADAVPGAATAEEVSVTPSGAQTVTAAALPKTGVNWLAAVGSAISGMVLLAAGFVLDRKSRRQN